MGCFDEVDPAEVREGFELGGDGGVVVPVAMARERTPKEK